MRSGKVRDNAKPDWQENILKLSQMGYEAAMAFLREYWQSHHYKKLNKQFTYRPEEMTANEYLLFALSRQKGQLSLEKLIESYTNTDLPLDQQTKNHIDILINILEMASARDFTIRNMLISQLNYALGKNSTFLNCSSIQCRNKDLSSLQCISGLYLREADFFGSTLPDFSHCDLTGVKFNAAVLKNLTHCRLYETVFKYADLNLMTDDVSHCDFLHPDILTLTNDTESLLPLFSCMFKGAMENSKGCHSSSLFSFEMKVVHSIINFIKTHISDPSTQIAMLKSMLVFFQPPAISFIFNEEYKKQGLLSASRAALFATVYGTENIDSATRQCINLIEIEITFLESKTKLRQIN